MLGYLASKDLVLKRKESLVALDLLRSAICVPEGSTAISLLHRLQAEHQQMAFVVDEQGSFSGLVTMEDLLEELVGEIFSEFREEKVVTLRWQEGGSAIVPGATPLREVNRALDLDLQEGTHWTTLGGLCLGKAGRIAVLGERLMLAPGVEAEIRETHGPRILTVKLWRIGIPEADT